MSASLTLSPDNRGEWREASTLLAAGEATLVSIWGDEGRMRMALRQASGAVSFVEVPCEDGSFPSVASAHAPADRLERAA